MTVPFTRAVATETGTAEQLNQIIDAWEGAEGKGNPLKQTEVDDADNYAADVRNKDTTNSLVARFRNAAGELLLSIVKEALTIGKDVTAVAGVKFDGVDVGSHSHTGAAGHGPQIPTAGLAADAVDGTKIADDAIDSEHYTDGSIDTEHIADGALSADAPGRAKMADAFVNAAKVAADVATQAELDAHAALTAAHGADYEQTPNRIVLRNAVGQAKVAAPSAGAHIALKSNVDTVQTNLNTHKTSADHDGRYFTEAQSDARFAPIAEGVTNGDSHNHEGGDGGALGPGAITNRTRKFFVPCVAGHNVTDGTDITHYNDQGLELPDSKDGLGWGYSMVPNDFVSGMTATPVLLPHASANIYGQTTVVYAQPGESYETHEDTSGALSAVAVTNLENNCIHQATLTSEAIGDLLKLQYRRDASDELDTIGDVVHLMGFIVEYTADS